MPPLGYSLFNNLSIVLYFILLYLSYKKDLKWIYHMSWLQITMITVFMYNFWEIREE